MSWPPFSSRGAIARRERREPGAPAFTSAHRSCDRYAEVSQVRRKRATTRRRVRSREPRVDAHDGHERCSRGRRGEAHERHERRQADFALHARARRGDRRVTHVNRLPKKVKKTGGNRQNHVRRGLTRSTLRASRQTTPSLSETAVKNRRYYVREVHYVGFSLQLGSH